MAIIGKNKHTNYQNNIESAVYTLCNACDNFDEEAFSELRPYFKGRCKTTGIGLAKLPTSDEGCLDFCGKRTSRRKSK